MVYGSTVSQMSGMKFQIAMVEAIAASKVVLTEHKHFNDVYSIKYQAGDYYRNQKFQVRY